jgi:hypothetical protein
VGLDSISAPAGVYCFSIYVKVNYSCWLSFNIGPTGTNSSTAMRYVSAADTFQRISAAFYYPGDGATCIVNMNCFAMAQAIVAWPASTAMAVGNQVVLGGNVYQCVAVTGDAHTAASGGPTGTGSANITDNHVTWTYVGPGATFTPYTNVGLWMINKGYRAAPYRFPSNADSAGVYGWVPRNYRGTSYPTAGVYFVGDICWNTVPASGGIIGWVCTTAGTPGVWKAFGQISS